MKKLFIFLIVIALLAIGGVIFFTATPPGQKIWDSMQSSTNDKSNYETKKDVEDTCRAMMASYKNDANTYRIYKDAATEYYRSIAEDARIRANQTVTTYKDYFEKNKYVWEGNAPKDIPESLEYVEQD